MSTYKRKSEFTEAFTKVLELECKELSISVSQVPQKEVLGILDSYFKERDAYLNSIVAFFKEESDVFTVKNRANKMKELLAKYPRIMEYRKKVDAQWDTTLESLKEKSFKFGHTRDFLKAFYIHELVFFSLLKSQYVSMAQLQGTIISNRVQMEKTQVKLTEKWHRLDDSAESINDKAINQAERIHDLLERAVEDLRDTIRQERDLIVKILDKGKDYVLASSQIAGPIAKMVQEVLDAKRPIDEIAPIFKKYMKSYSPICIMYTHIQDDVKEYLGELGLQPTQAHYELTLKEVGKKNKTAPTKASEEDAELLYTSCGAYLKKNLEKFMRVNNLFIRAHKEIFLGPLAPKYLERMLAKDRFEGLITDFEQIDVHSSFKKMVEDAIGTWYYDLERIDESGNKSEKQEIKDLLDYNVGQLRGVLTGNEYNAGEKVKSVVIDKWNAVMKYLKRNPS